MTRIATLLAGPPGVYPWTGDEPAHAIVRTARAAGWTVAQLDRSAAGGRAALLQAIATTLHFPPYFGGNLDALADCLRDLDAPTLLLWDATPGEHETTRAPVLAVLRDRSADTALPPFTVLLRT